MTDRAERRDSRTLLMMRGGAVFYAGCSFALAAFMIYTVLSAAVSGGGSAITLPVGGPATQFDLPGMAPSYSDAHFTEIEFTASRLSFGASILYYAPRALTPLAHGIVAIAIMVLVGQVRAGAPFGRGVVRGLVVSAVTIAVIGSLNQILFGYGVSLARWELLGDTELVGGYISPTAFDFAPIFIGLALAVIARVFTVGSQLQRDTAGLV